MELVFELGIEEVVDPAVSQVFGSPKSSSPSENSSSFNEIKSKEDIAFINKRSFQWFQFR